ncbi:MBL fold metallo-hydrolase [candidate division KSB1 bacterium]
MLSLKTVPNVNLTWIVLALLGFAVMFCTPGTAAEKFETDVIETNAGPVEITFIGHGTLMLEFNQKIIHIDPVGREADYSKLPKANLILVTHEHGDHLDADLIKQIKKPRGTVIVNQASAEKVDGASVMNNGDIKYVQSIRIEAVPAYNVVHKRDGGAPFHPKGTGNGYILIFGTTRIYVAGDTENIPEMKELKNIGVAFLPMNLPYTMTPEMTAAAAQVIKPKILYPYHYGDTDVSKLVALLKDNQEIEVRIRDLE